MYLFDSYKIKNHIRLIELFAGVGSQAMALRDIGADFEHYRVVEFDKYAVKSYNTIHGTNFEPTDIRNVKGEDLGIVDTQNFTYLLTYSFPCQDLSLAGKQRGMTKGSGTRSGLLWEVERLLNETENLPQVLLMENVPQVHGTKNIDDFNLWIDFLKSKGYSNFWQDLNAKDYGVAQNRKRCFMVSILGNEFYEFPQPVKLNKCIKDYLEDEVDEKYYIKSEKAFKLILDLQERGILEGKEKLVCDSTINNPKEREVMNTITSRYDGGIRNIQAVDGAVVEKVQANRACLMNRNRIEKVDNDVSNTLMARDYKEFGNQAMNGVIECQKSKSNEIIVIGKMDHTLDNTLESANRIYSKDGICPTIPTCAGAKTEQRLEPNGDGLCNTLTSVQKDNLLLEEKKINKIGQISNEGSQCGTVVSDDGLFPTISAGTHGYANPHICTKSTKSECINLYDDQGKETSFQDRVYKTDKISPAITTSFRPSYEIEKYRIRKLTPKECWRLMGFSDEDFEKAAKVNSNTQLYKQAGNSIVKDVLMAIFRQMID